MAKLEEAFTRYGYQSLGKATRALVCAGVDTDWERIRTQSVADDAAACLQQYALKFQPDLVILVTHGHRGVRRAILGSVAERFLRFSTCPVLLVRDEPRQR